MNLLLLLAALVPLCSSVSVTNRHKRFSDANCRTTPESSSDEVIPEGDSVLLECTFDSSVESCTWTHRFPLTDGDMAEDDIRCAGAPGSSSICQADPRIQMSFPGDNRCSIVISGTNADDTGAWELYAMGIQNGMIASAHHEFELFTYNQSTVELYDEDYNDVSNGNVDSTYNDQEGSSNWESLEFVCLAQGGRPQPTIKWYINNNENDDLNNYDEFRINEATSCIDQNGYVCNEESRINFDVDDNLMARLEEWGVEVNPEDESVGFELNCESAQEAVEWSEKLSVMINIQMRPPMA